MLTLYEVEHWEIGAATERQKEGLGAFVRERSYLPRDVVMLAGNKVEAQELAERARAGEDTTGLIYLAGAVMEEINGARDELEAEHAINLGLRELVATVREIVVARGVLRGTVREAAAAADKVSFNEYHFAGIVERAEAGDFHNITKGRRRKYGRDRPA